MIWLECWINRKILLEQFPYEQLAVALYIRTEPYGRFMCADCANKQIISTAGNDNSQEYYSIPKQGSFNLCKRLFFNNCSMKLSLNERILFAIVT